MLASTFFDPVLGLDTHIVLVPAPPAPPIPTPLPFPFVGLVFDPAGLAIISAIGMAMGGGPGIVLINSLPATICGTSVTNKLTMPHVPAPGPFAKPPTNDALLMFGSLDVSFSGLLAVRLGEIALSCSDPCRMPTSVVLAIPKGPLVLVLRPPVPDVGLIAAMGVLKVAFKIIGKAMKLGMKLFKKLRFSQLASENWAKIADRLKFGGDNPGRFRQMWNDFVCFVTGHPVDVATGRLITRQTEIEIRGALPLCFERRYDSSMAGREGALGWGWTHCHEQAVWHERGCAVYRGPDGREIEFPTLELPDRVLGRGTSVYHPFERLTIRGLGEHRYQIETAEGLVHEFGPLAGAAPGSAAAPARILRTRHPAGAQLSYGYDARGRLAEVAHSSGRTLRFRHDARGRLLQVNAAGAVTSGPPTTQLAAAYAYDQAGDLIEARDAGGRAYRFQYAGEHLLVKETDRNGLSFYFQYDGLGPSARCVRTWGDGGLYDHVLTYDTLAHRTLVENSLGEVTLYQMNEINQVEAVTDALGRTTRHAYDPRNGLPTQTIDPAGASEQREYDQRGNCVRYLAANGAATVTEYDQRNLPVREIDTLGGAWEWAYDARGRLVGRRNPLEQRAQFRWDEDRLVEITDPLGQSVKLGHDAAGEVTSIRGPDGSEHRRVYDGLGRCVSVIDAMGSEQRREHDALGRVVRVHEPDGNVNELEYDGEGAPVHVRDQHHDVRFSYCGLGRLASRTEAGVSVRFEYDTEERLVAIHDPLGAAHRFELGATGLIDGERRFDGGHRRYQRDAAGRVIKLLRPEGRSTEYQYDPAGLLASVKHSDGTGARYRYRQDGGLVGVASASASVSFQRDALGRVVEEATGDDWVRVEYDAAGRRVGLRSSRGLHQRIRRNAAGDPVSVTVRRPPPAPAGDELPQDETAARARLLPGDEVVWEARFGRDSLGQELERVLPGGIRARWKRDAIGRPVRQEIHGAAGLRAARDYTWDVGGRLTMIADAARGPVRYQHDPLGQLAAAVLEDGTLDLRLPDAVGNLFRTQARDDRKYGPGGQLLEATSAAGVTRYRYDGEGNLIEKTLPDGGVWRYAWNGAGNLVRVIRPDGQTIELGYDPLGRRLSRTFRGRTTRWIWDGNLILHEWQEGSRGEDGEPGSRAAGRARAQEADEIAVARREALLSGRPALGPPPSGGDSPRDSDGGSADAPITWLFEPDSFAPLAKLLGERRWGIVVDHLSTPIAMFDAQGVATWSAAVGVYAELRQVEGERAACPFRRPGQYEDQESGLYYNRYRYYDPESGQYLSADPLGIQGGLNAYSYSDDPNTIFDVFGLAKARCERFVRYMTPAEAEATKTANGLVPDINKVTREETGKAKWISLPGAATERPGTTRGNTVRMEFEVEEGTAAFLESKSVNFDDVAGEAAVPDQVIKKSNEPGSYGVGKNLLEEFNRRVKRVIPPAPRRR